MTLVLHQLTRYFSSPKTWDVGITCLHFKKSATKVKNWVAGKGVRRRSCVYSRRLHPWTSFWSWSYFAMTFFFNTPHGGTTHTTLASVQTLVSFLLFSLALFLSNAFFSQYVCFVCWRWSVPIGWLPSDSWGSGAKCSHSLKPWFPA